ncbi:MAG: histidine kinase [Bacteroidota bacterium]
MEYDNDRLVKRPFKMEFFYWGLIFLLYPLINAVGFFPADWRMWIALFFVSAIMFPAYLLFTMVVAPRIFFQKQYKAAIFFSVLFLVVILAVLFILFSIVGTIFPAAADTTYFSVTPASAIRECLWAITNMGLAVGIFFINRSLNQQDELLTLEKDSTGFKVKYLRSQLSPHFLFNTLNSIYSLSLQKSDKAPEVVVKLADLMRYIIYDCTAEKVALNKEIEFIENYLAIQKIRHQADVRFTVEGETDGIMIEPFLFISFIENGFKHAFNSSFNEPFIYITLKTCVNQVALSVVNNTNIDMETQAKRIHGNGIRNSKSLLELLYPAAYELDIIQTHKEEGGQRELRFRHAKQRLESLYPDSHTLDVILSNDSFTVSLIIKPSFV